MNSDLLESKGKVNPVDLHVGTRLKRRRVILGLSQQDLGDAVNVSIQQIQKYEKAINRISSGKLHDFANLLKVPVSYFFENLSSSSSQSYHVADAQEDLIHDEYSAEKDLVTLVKAFSDIRDAQVRRKVIDLIKTLSNSTAILRE